MVLAGDMQTSLRSYGTVCGRSSSKRKTRHNPMNPAIGKVGGDGVIRVTVSTNPSIRLFTKVDPETTRTQVIREANTNGMWAFPISLLNIVETIKRKHLTFIQAGSIILFEFPEEQEHDEAYYTKKAVQCNTEG